MAKNNRFPSDANKKKPTAESEKAREAGVSAPAQETQASVDGVQQDLIAVQYHKDNHHILGIGAHALRKGVNHLPKAVWEEAKQHPSVQHLIKSGHISEPSEEVVSEPQAEEAEKPEQEEESDESEESAK